MKTGGHAIPEATIRRRYQSGLKNFFNLYKPLADSWQFYDNSITDGLSLIASASHCNELSIKNYEIWQQLLENYSDE